MVQTTGQSQTEKSGQCKIYLEANLMTAKRKGSGGGREAFRFLKLGAIYWGRSCSMLDIRLVMAFGGSSMMKSSRQRSEVP